MKKFFIISVMLTLPATVLAQGQQKGFSQFELGSANGKIEATFQAVHSSTDVKLEQKGAGGLAVSLTGGGGAKSTSLLWLQGGLRYFGTYSLQPQLLRIGNRIFDMDKFELNIYQIGLGLGFGGSFADLGLNFGGGLAEALLATAFVEGGLVFFDRSGSKTETGSSIVTGGNLGYRINETTEVILGFSNVNVSERKTRLLGTVDGIDYKIGDIKYKIEASTVTFGFRGNF